MQPIKRAPCLETPPSSAAYLAALIDERARTGGVPADPSRDPGAAPGLTDGRNGNVLIWVDGTADGPDPPTGQSRGMIVVAHGSSPDVEERSFVISYPVEAGTWARRVPAVLDLLRAKGWSLLAFRRGTTASGHANTAVLVNTARPGGEQRLWLTEPVPASRTQGRARTPGLPRSLRFAAAPVALATRRRGRAWTRKGSSGEPGA